MFITDSQQLDRFCASAAECQVVGVDTEFIRERTFQANLCLVQIATESGAIACIDPLAIEDLSALAALFTDTSVLKVFHAAKQDLEVIFQNLDVMPNPVFDTQLAAAFCGDGDQLGYAALVERICGRFLSKGQTRTNWQRRPLQPAQLQYAEEDVLYLADLHADTSARLAELGRFEWFSEEIDRMLDKRLYQVDADNAWRRVKGVSTLLDVERGRAVKLACWRESTAVSSDLPREWVVKDRAIIALSKWATANYEDVLEAGNLDTNGRRKWCEEIIDVLQQPVEEMSSDRPQRLTKAQEKIRKRLMGYLQERTTALGISTSLIGNRRDIESLILGDQGCAMLHGWRRGAIGDELLEVLATFQTS